MRKSQYNISKLLSPMQLYGKVRTNEEIIIIYQLSLSHSTLIHFNRYQYDTQSVIKLQIRFCANADTNSTLHLGRFRMTSY